MASILDVGPGSGQPQMGRSSSHEAEPVFSQSLGHARSLDDMSDHGRNGHSPLALARLIEGEIIPRLLMAHRTLAPVAQLGADVGADRQISADEFVRFVPLVLTQEVHGLLAEIDVLLRRGVTLDTLYLDLLAPAARRLGEFWEEDNCDFVDVTMGLWRLQQLVHELGARTAGNDVALRADRRAFFAAAPGDQHSFGVVMIEDFFRRAGWQTWSAPTVTVADLTDLVATHWFELVGLTVTCEHNIETLSETIAALRNRSRNAAVQVMVGGRIFSDDPGLAARVGADGTAPDGRQAVYCAETLLDRIVHPSAAAQPIRG